MDFIAGAGLAVGTLLVLVIALGVVGFVVLFARRGDRAASRSRGSNGSSILELGRRAGTLLVRADDAVREADAELGYAIAQFGSERARPWAAALETARRNLAEAFRLRHALDDSVPDSDRETREWTLQIIALCEQALGVIAEQDAEFTGLRGQEANAEGTLRDLVRRIDDTTARLGAVEDTLADLTHSVDPVVLAGVRSNPTEARDLLTRAGELADAAARGISTSGVSSVSGILSDAERTVRRADALLDAVDRTARDLDSASAALERLRATTIADLEEARAERDSAPDADSGAAIIDAIAAVEAFIPSAPANPVADLDRLGAAVSRLDLALASSRNQKQRFAHARAAYEGTLVSARSQIAVVRDLVAGGRAGVSARTRLAEAERQLMLAEAETDPVDALDTVRRAVTHARDADALARYDLGG